MHFDVMLPYGQGRSFFDNGIFNRAEPVFKIKQYTDSAYANELEKRKAMGDRANYNNFDDADAAEVPFGPLLYQYLNQYAPYAARRVGEDMHFHGIVGKQPHEIPGLYAYYGVGDPADNVIAHAMKGGSHNPVGAHAGGGYGIHVLGYGDTAFPKQDFGRSPSGIENFMYSEKVDDPTLDNTSEAKSRVLTNILNGPMDFSPLFAPLYKYTDPDYDPENDPEGRGPRTTGDWVPRTKDGQIIYKPDGSMSMRPVFPFMSMPIYNFRHPMWQKDPVDAWNLINSYDDAIDWKKWGAAPIFADYSGNAALNSKGEPKDIDYYLENMKRLSKPGWMVDFDKLDKDSAKEEYEKAKAGRRKIIIRKRDKAAEEKQLKDYVGDADERIAKARAMKFAQNHIGNDDHKQGVKSMADYYKAMIHKAVTTPEIASNYGLTKEDEKSLREFFKNKSFETYNVIPDEADRRDQLITDYLKDKKSRETQGNILAGVKDRF